LGAADFEGAMKIEYLADRLEFTETLASWHRREWGRYRPDETLEMRVAKLRSRSNRREIPTAFVATNGDTLLGSAMLVEHDMDTKLQWSPWLAGVVVSPEHRRRGIGAALVDRVVAEARDLGVPVIYLFTFSTEKYYAKLGWHFIESTQYLGTNVTVMSRTTRQACT
jgi:predicted N-acetyltransferase YhbS